MKVRQPWWNTSRALCTLAAIMVFACGKEEDHSASTTVAGSSVSNAGSGAQAGSAAKAGSASNLMVMCSGEQCVVNLSLKAINLQTEACCTSDDKCGQTNSEMKCLEQNAAGEKDAKCPDVHVTAINNMDFTQVGCCTPKGECGGLFEQVGWGCVPRETLLADMGGPLEAMPCGSSH
jgi:hypothetical protein